VGQLGQGDEWGRCGLLPLSHVHNLKKMNAVKCRSEQTIIENFDRKL